MIKKTERINLRVTEYDKMKLLMQSDKLNMDLTSYICDTLRRNYNNTALDYFVDVVKQVINIRDDLKRYTSIAIDEYTLESGDIAYSCQHLKSTYFTIWEMIDEMNDNVKHPMPRHMIPWLLDNWDIVKHELIKLGWYKDEEHGTN